jgi:microcystin-dependent protein
MGYTFEFTPTRVGEITEFIDDGKGRLPDGWVLIDGQTLEISKYPKAYEIYGGAISSTHFTLPGRHMPNNLSSYYIYMGTNA